MTEYIVLGESLKRVADKIREKTGDDSPLEFPADFETAIDGLVDTSDATATGMDILAGKTAYVDGELIHGAIPSKTSADLTASGDTVIVPSGYYDEEASKSVNSGSVSIPSQVLGAAPSISVSAGGLITATVNNSVDPTISVTPGYVAAVSTGVIGVAGVSTEQLPTQAAQTITPTTTDQTIASGKYLTGAQTIKGDANLIPANIADGVTIFGVLGTHQGGGAQPQLNAPTISVSSSGNQSLISISNPATNGNFVEKYGVYLNGVWLFDTTSTSNVPVTTIGNHSVTVKACGTNFLDSPASNAVQINNYTITVTCIDCTADAGNPTYISNNGATATLVFTPNTGLEIRADSISINDAIVISVNKDTNTVIIGSATANVTMTVTALQPLTEAILTVTGLGNEDPTTVTFTESGATFNWNFEEETIGNNVFIKIPTMYRKILDVTGGQITSFSLSNKKVDNDYQPYPCFLDSDGTTVLSYIYIGKYSVGGLPETARTNARALGPGYQLYDWQIQKLFVDLAMMKAKTVNFSSVITTNDYLGIYELNQAIFIDGIYHNDTTWYAATNPADYVSNPSTHPATGYSALSYAAPSTSSQEIKSLGYDSNNPFVNYPSNVISNTDYDTYYCDGYNYQAGNHPVFSYVSYVNDNSNGLWKCRANHAWSFTGYHSRLCYRPVST